MSFHDHDVLSKYCQKHIIAVRPNPRSDMDFFRRANFSESDFHLYPEYPFSFVVLKNFYLQNETVFKRLTTGTGGYQLLGRYQACSGAHLRKRIPLALVYRGRMGHRNIFSLRFPRLNLLVCPCVHRPTCFMHFLIA